MTRGWWQALRMSAARSMSVSDLKNKLLEVVRRVQEGEIVEITKDGKPVALLSPFVTTAPKATGFARLEVRGDLETGTEEWSHDLENLAPRARRKR